ncbi:zeta toxin family protein [Kribbella sp. NPDC048928]|uniref:zeta toxin family protein n=1 Tax=Kribbella sp. NPDC048928 TaxID=3364111 RepID=UPI00371AE656
MAEVDRSRYLLTEEHNERIFREDIVPAELPGTSQRDPVVVFVAGQTGAGKSAVTALVEGVLARRGEAVNIDLDTYKPHHPRYQWLVDNDDATAGAYTSIDGHKWMEKAEAYAIQQRFDVVMESAMRDPRDFEEPARRFRAAGYRVEVVIVAVDESLSRLGALDRYLQQTQDLGAGRVIDAAIHDACYRGVLRSADAIDTERLADHVFVSRRGGDIVYANHLGADGTWAQPAGTRTAVETERGRTWTEAEANRFLGNLQRLQVLAGQLPDAAQRFARPEAAAVVELAGRLLEAPARVRAAELAAGMPQPDSDTAIGLLAMSHSAGPNRAVASIGPGTARPVTGPAAGTAAEPRRAEVDRTGEDQGF